MAEELEIKMSSFQEATEVKDTDELIILQDGKNKKVKSPKLEEKVLSKVGDTFLKKTDKIPNENLTFGKVEQGDNNVISGGDVYNKFKEIKKTIVESRNPFLTDDFDYFINIKDGTRFTKIDGIIKQHIGTDNIVFKYPNVFKFNENTIYQNVNGYFIDLKFYEEVSKYYRDTQKTYVCEITGNDANNGLSPDKPIRSLKNAYSIKGARNIVLMCDVSRSNAIALSISDGKSLIITSIDGKSVNIGNDIATSYTWVKYNSIYKTTVSAVYNIFDSSKYIDNKRGFFSYKLVDSLDVCESTPFSFFKSGNDVYLNNASNIIDSNIKISREQSVFNNTINSNVSFVYCENLNIYGQDKEAAFRFKCIGTQYNATVIANNIKSYGNKLGDGISFNNLKNVFVLNSGAFECRRDALNYHTSTNTFEKMKAIEIDCWSLDTGKDFPTEGSSNGSTAHDGMSIIRIGGNFDTSNGSTIVDVNEGIESLNLGVTAANPTRTNTACFHVQNGNMWTYDCVALSNIQSFRQDGDSGNLFTFNNKKIGATFGNVQELSAY